MGNDIEDNFHAFDTDEEFSLENLFSSASKFTYQEPETVEPLSGFFSENKTSADTQGASVGVDDFATETEKYAFNKIDSHVRRVLSREVGASLKDGSIDWLFRESFIDHTGDGVDFDLACNVLGVRPSIVRIRLQYGFYANNIFFDEPFHEDAVDIPAAIQSEVLLEAGFMGLDIARHIWTFPGLRADKIAILLEISTQEAREVTEKLEEKGLISVMMGFWYFTTRNPLIMKTNVNFHWSRILA